MSASITDIAELAKLSKPPCFFQHSDTSWQKINVCGNCQGRNVSLSCNDPCERCGHALEVRTARWIQPPSPYPWWWLTMPKPPGYWEFLSEYQARTKRNVIKAASQIGAFDAKNPRFVWNVGAIQEEFPDMPEQGDTVDLIDRFTGETVVRIESRYGQLLCLQHTQHGAPFEVLEKWLNSLSKAALEAEGLPTTP